MTTDDLESRLDAFGRRWRERTTVPAGLEVDLQEHSRSAPSGRGSSRPALVAATAVVVIAGAVAVVILGHRQSGPAGDPSAAASTSDTAPAPTAGDRRYLCGDGISLPVTASRRVAVQLQRNGNQYTVTAAVTDPALAVPDQVVASLIVIDGAGTVVGTITNESPVLQPPITLRQGVFTSLDTITLKSPSRTVCSGDSNTPDTGGTYQVAAQVRVGADVYGTSAAITVALADG